MKMNARQLHEEIKETNLSFFRLTQKMLRNDKAGAMSSLGLSDEMAGLVAGLSPAQLLKISANNLMMCSFHFDERILLDMVTSYSKDNMLPEPSGKASRTAGTVAV
jgi:flagellar transcriptional activator FlhD